MIKCSVCRKYSGLFKRCVDCTDDEARFWRAGWPLLLLLIAFVVWWVLVLGLSMTGAFFSLPAIARSDPAALVLGLLLLFGMLYLVVLPPITLVQTHRQFKRNGLPKAPGLAAFLSLFIAGAGQFYNGSLLAGFAFLGAGGCLYLLSLIPPFALVTVPLSILLHGLAAVLAYQRARFICLASGGTGYPAQSSASTPARVRMNERWSARRGEQRRKLWEVWMAGARYLRLDVDDKKVAIVPTLLIGLSLLASIGMTALVGSLLRLSPKGTGGTLTFFAILGVCLVISCNVLILVCGMCARRGQRSAPEHPKRRR